MSPEVKSLSNSSDRHLSVYIGEQFRAFAHADPRANHLCRIGISNSLSIIWRTIRTAYFTTCIVGSRLSFIAGFVSQIKSEGGVVRFQIFHSALPLFTTNLAS